MCIICRSFVIPTVHFFHLCEWWQMNQTGHHLGRRKNLKIYPKNSNLTIGGPQTVYKRTQWDCPFVPFVSMVTNKANGQMGYKQKRSPFPSSQLCDEGHAHTLAESILKFVTKRLTHSLAETIPKFATNAWPTLASKRYWNLQQPNCATVFRFPFLFFFLCFRLRVIKAGSSESTPPGSVQSDPTSAGLPWFPLRMQSRLAAAAARESRVESPNCCLPRDWRHLAHGLLIHSGTWIESGWIRLDPQLLLVRLQWRKGGRKEERYNWQDTRRDTETTSIGLAEADSSYGRRTFCHWQEILLWG